MNKEILIPMSRITDKSDMDTVKRSKKFGDRNRGLKILMEAQEYWRKLERFRRERERNKRYTYGDQWSDMVTADCETMTEEEYIKKKGNYPFKNNLMRRFVKSVVGVYRTQHIQPVCSARDRDEETLGETMTTVLEANQEQNEMTEVSARTLEEFMMGGLAIFHLWYGWRNDKLDCWTDYVQPNNFIIDNNMRDFRGWDVSCIGEIHDISFQEMISKFATDTRKYNELAEIYGYARDNTYMQSYTGYQFGYSDKERSDFSFLFPTDCTRCRVIEVWRKESKPRYRCHDFNTGDIFKIELSDKPTMVDAVNEARIEQGTTAGMQVDDIPLIEATWFIDSYWYYYYLSPLGDILQEGETPYWHKSHPYVFKAYPYIDGEIHSFQGDIIDQQRYINRTAMLSDWITRAGAKGALLIPEECISDKMSIEQILDQWARPDGVVITKTQNSRGPIQQPQQLSNNVTNVGLTEMLNVQLKFMEDISGVHGALMGQTPTSGTSGTLYNQQVQQASTTLVDLLDSYNNFIKQATYKNLKNIQQFYDTKRYLKISGKNSWVEYDPDRVQNVEYDLSLDNKDNIPVYRQIANDFLLKIWDKGQLTLEDILEVGEFPYADALLQHLRSNRERIEQGQQPEPMSPELQQQVQQDANMDAVNKVYDAVHNQPEQQQQ